MSAPACSACGQIPSDCPDYRAGTRADPAVCLRLQLIDQGEPTIILGYCPEGSCLRAYTGYEAKTAPACPGCGVA